MATGGGEFDVVMISNYETPQWAENGWLTNLQSYADETEGYDPDDFFPSIRQALSYKGDLYSVPFYGESSFLVYRKDMFEQAGLTMPDKPTWPEVARAGRASWTTRRTTSAASACAGWPAGARTSPRSTPSSTPSAAAGSTRTGTPS